MRPSAPGSASSAGERVEQELAWTHQERAYLGVYQRPGAEPRPHGPGSDMCGIAGCYQQVDGQKLVDVMTDRIAHRGPDAAGIWSHEDDRVSVHLGHRRLSIIDLSTAADQPLSKDGPDPGLQRRAVQLPRAAGRAGRPRRQVSHQVRHRGGAGGLAAAGDRMRCGGSAACSRSRWPTRATGELFLARDPFGIKPLYYLPRGDGVLFASELKALIAAVGPRAADRAGRAGRLDALLLAARTAAARSTACTSCPPARGPGCSPDGRLDGRAVLGHRRRGCAGRGRAAGRPGPGDRGVGHRAPGRRRAGLELPVRRPGLEHHHRAGAPGRAGDRRLHDHLPAGGPAAGGDARRRASTPARSRAQYGIEPARDRDLARTSSTCCPAWSTCSTSRSATRRPSTRC